MLASSGLRWTSLRNGFHAARALAHLEPALASGVIELAGDGPIAWTTHDDLAEAAAVILTGGEDLADGPTAVLTATATFDFAALCALASEQLGRTIRRELVTESILRTKLEVAGLPAPRIELVLGLQRAAERGEFAKTSSTLTDLLGREPQGMPPLLAESLASPD
jgi:NAD(P)H dehydrogenase (quinone)